MEYTAYFLSLFQGWYDRAIEGQWSWVDCLASTDWANGKSANNSRGDAATGEDCGMLLGNSGLLDDKNCSLPMKFVCETTRKGTFTTSVKISRIQ